MTFKVKDGISIAGTTFVDGSRNITIGNLNGNTPIHSGNYSSYIPSLTGSGASGTWGISITGNAATVSSITSSQVTTALGFTPYNSSNPSGYITSSALSSYLPLAGGTMTGSFTVSSSTWEKLTLEATGVTAKIRFANDANGVSTSANVKWNGSAWVEDDTTKKKLAYIQHLGNGRHEFRTAPTGAGVSFTTGLTIDESAVNSLIALQQSGNQVLHAGNYNSYALPLSGGSVSYIGISNASAINFKGAGSGTYNTSWIYSDSSVTSWEAPITTDSSAGTKVPFILTWRGGYATQGGLRLTGGSSGELGGNAILHAANYSSYAWERSGSWKPTSLSGTTRQVGIASPDGGEFALSYSGGQTYAYVDGWFYQNEGQYRVLDTSNYSSYALPLSGGTVTGRTTFSDGLRIGPTPGDPNAYIITRTMPAGDPNAGNEATELLLFHANDNANSAGPDYITLRAPGIRFQTYDNAAVSDPDASAGWNNRLSISPAGLVTVHGDRPITINTGNGSVFSKGSSGGWGMGHLFYGSSGTYRGGFGALGGADSLSYYWVGQDYNDATLYVYPGSKVVAQRDLIVNGRAGGNYGNRIIVGADDTSYTMQDTNMRPTIQIHGQYPVLSLNHTVTSNSNHGPTVQFTCNGTGNQFVIGTGGTGAQLDMGYSASTDWNPHNGIAGYTGTTFFRANTSGYIGLGALGDWGALGGGDPGYNLHFKGANNASGGYAAVFENIANAVTGGGVLFQNNYGNHSYGIVAEFRVGSASGSDRPSILFSSALTTTTWSVGYGYYDDQFRINQNHGHRSSDWGANRFRIDTSGTSYFNGNVAIHAGNYGSYALPLSGGTVTGSSLFFRNNPGISNSSYVTGNNHFELRTDNSSNPAIGFHRSGYSAVTLYHDTNSSLRLRDANTGTDGQLLHSANYNSYAPTLTGGGASGAWGISIYGDANRLQTNYIGGQQLNPQTYFNNGVGLKVAMTAAAGVWSDTLWINGYAGGDVLQMCALHTQRNGSPRMYISAQASTATSYGTLYEFLTAYNYNDYSPTKTGGGASGTWGINVTGSAGSVDWGSVTSRPGWLNGGSYIENLENANSWANSGFYQNAGGGSNWPSQTWYNAVHVRHSNQGNYHGFTLAMSYYDNRLWHRSFQGSGTFQTWAYALSSTNYTDLVVPISGGSFTGKVNFANGSSLVASFVGAHGQYGKLLELQTPGGGGQDGAQIWFHKQNAKSWGAGVEPYGSNGWAIYEDGSNGTWGTQRMRIDPGGNAVFNQNVTAYSDERLKTDWTDLPSDFVENLAKVKSGEFTRIDGGKRQVGVSAQSLLNVMPASVVLGDDGYYTVAYGNAALASAVELAKEVTDLRARVAQLENLISKLLLKDRS
jgi:hypothetical protein